MGSTTDPLSYTDQGTYMVTWMYDDGNGNISQQIQTVIVDDVTPPVPDLANLPDVTGECSATITVTPTATDNCEGTIIGTTTDPLTYEEQGTFMVTWTCCRLLCLYFNASDTVESFVKPQYNRPINASN